MIFFYLFILAIALLGSVTIGPLSIRVYMTCLMIIYLAYQNVRGVHKSYFREDHSLLNLYVVFLIAMGISLGCNGEIFEYEYLKKMLAYHLVCVVTFIAIERYVNSYNDLRRTIILLGGILLLNNIVTYLQYSGSPIGWAIGMAFSDITSNIDYATEHETLLGASQTPGIIGGVVRNAFFIAVISPLLLVLTDNRNSLYIRLFGIVVFATSIVSCFMTQQRTAFALILVAIVVYVYSEFRKKPLLVIFLMAIICYVVSSNLDINNSDLGRFADNTDDTRNRLYAAAIDYITQYPVFGGPMRFQRMAGLSSHNLILDSWIFAGLGGFFIMVILFLKTIVKGATNLIVGFKTNAQDRYMVFTALSTLSAMAYGLFHNTSYLTGDVIIFISLSIMLKVIALRNNNVAA